MEHPFVRRRPPKTTGREEFGKQFTDSLLSHARRKMRLPDADIVATVTAFTAASIAEAYQRFVLPGIDDRRSLEKLQIILGGGGAKNPVLRRMLVEEIGKRMPIPGVEMEGLLLTHEDFGIPNSAKEALAFAIMAHETLAGRPSNVPSATGATRQVILGKIVRGNLIQPRMNANKHE
jgi:anhydro-N-acetylmuramic acid kinase